MRKRFALLLLAVLPWLGLLHAQESNQELPPEYLRVLRMAAEEFRLENYDKVLRRIDQLDKIQADTAVALNLRGAVATSQRNFEQAAGYFRKALEVAPEYFAPRFNLGEVLFLQQKYADARNHFLEMIKNEKGARKELLQFKIFMAYLMEGNTEKATEWMDQIPFPSDTPAYYFAKAAWEFRAGNTAEAHSWIQSSLRIFGDTANDLYMEAFTDVGWVVKERAGGERAPKASPDARPVAPGS